MRTHFSRLSALLALLVLPAVAAPHARDTSAALLREAVDSLAGKPLAGAVVEVVPMPAGTPLRLATTDANGRWIIGGLAPARYLVGLRHEALDALGLELAPRAVEVASGRNAFVDLGVPSARGLYPLLCAGPGGVAQDSSGAVIGVLRGADGGTAV